FYIVTPIHIANHVYEAPTRGVKFTHPLHAHFHQRRHFCGRALHFIKLGRGSDVVFFSHCCFIFLSSIRCQTLLLAVRLLGAQGLEFPFAQRALFVGIRSGLSPSGWRSPRSWSLCFGVRPFGPSRGRHHSLACHYKENPPHQWRQCIRMTFVCIDAHINHRRYLPSCCPRALRAKHHGYTTPCPLEQTAPTAHCRSPGYAA